MLAHRSGVDDGVLCIPGDTMVTVSSGGTASFSFAVVSKYVNENTESPSVCIVAVAEWVIEPPTPVNVNVAAPGRALIGALKVTVCEDPGAMDRVAGDAVTPAGSPLIATATLPENPLIPLAEIANWLWCPCVTATNPGATVNPKSGETAAWIWIAALAVWLSEPLVPCSVKAAVPGATVGAALKVMVLGVPAVILNWPPVDALIPAGSPAMDTATLPLNAFNGVTTTETGELAAPWVNDTEPG